MLLLLGELVEGQEGVGVPSRAVADPVALPEEASLPDDLGAVRRLLQVLVLLEDLKAKQDNPELPQGPAILRPGPRLNRSLSSLAHMTGRWTHTW